jgi:DivIVA domain-containing protein
MDDDDPEKRITDLERQLGEARGAADRGATLEFQQGAISPPPPAGFPPTAGRHSLAPGGSLTPEQVRSARFSRPPRGKRGYNQDEVDAFLDRVEAALRDPAGRSLTPEQVGNVGFSQSPGGKRGYNQDEVDVFLDRVKGQIERPAQDFNARTTAAPQSVVYSGQGGPHNLDAAAGLGPFDGGAHERISPNLSSAATDGGNLPPPTMKIRPNPFLFWTPRWRDWRSDHVTTNQSSDSILADLLWLVLEPIFDFLWPWVMGAICWVLEVCAVVLLAPVALLTSVLGIPRHRLMAVPDDGGAGYMMNRGSWYAMRRARREALAQLTTGRAKSERG